MTNQKNIALIDKAPNRTNYHNHFKDSFEFDHYHLCSEFKKKVLKRDVDIEIDLDKIEEEVSPERADTLKLLHSRDNYVVVKDKDGVDVKISSNQESIKDLGNLIIAYSSSQELDDGRLTDELLYLKQGMAVWLNFEGKTAHIPITEIKLAHCLVGVNLARIGIIE